MHKVGNLLKKQLEDDVVWKRVLKKINKSKNTLKQSGLSFLCSPELFELAHISKEIVRKLHIEKEGWKAAEKLVEAHIKSEKGRFFAKKIIDFLKIQCEKAPLGMLLLGSSEIIESAMSKLKLLSRECGTSGFSASIIGLGACFGASDYKSMVKAFEIVNPKDVEAWGEKYIGETIGNKRRQALKPIKKVDLDPELGLYLEGKIMIA